MMNFCVKIIYMGQLILKLTKFLIINVICVRMKQFFSLMKGVEMLEKEDIIKVLVATRPNLPNKLATRTIKTKVNAAFAQWEMIVKAFAYDMFPDASEHERQAFVEKCYGV